MVTCLICFLIHKNIHFTDLTASKLVSSNTQISHVAFNALTFTGILYIGLATLSIGGIDEIHNQLVANPIYIKFPLLYSLLY